MDLYGSLFRSFLYPFWEGTIRRRATLSRLELLKRTEWRSRDELLAMQTDALRRLLRHAFANVPFYRQRIEAAGLAGETLGKVALDDLRKIPILGRDEGRAAGKALESTAPPLPAIHKHTSGTTGQPLLFSYDAESEIWRQAVRQRAYEWAGYRLGDRVLHFWGAPVSVMPPPLAKRAKIALDRRLKRETYLFCAVMDEPQLRRAVDFLARRRPQVLLCYAQAGGELARFINHQGLRDWPDITVICGAEKLYPHDRAELEKAFGPRVSDTYGCREVMLIASQCEANEGLHVSMENLVVELIVRGKDGAERPAREGEVGEVVLTDLHNFGMPFVRYANGDVATMGPESRCACGRSLARIASVEGRASETVHDARGAAVSGLAFSFLFAGLETAVRQFQVVQHPDRSVTVRIVPAREGALAPQTVERVRNHAASLVAGCDARVELVPDLPRTKAGKHRLVVVER